MGPYVEKDTKIAEEGINENTYLVFRLKKFNFYFCFQRLFFWNITEDVRRNFLSEIQNLFVISIILVLQVVPVHPVSHPKQVPFCM